MLCSADVLRSHVLLDVTSASFVIVTAFWLTVKMNAASVGTVPLLYETPSPFACLSLNVMGF